MDNIYSLNIERAVLSSIIFEGTLEDDIIEKLTPEVFYLPAHSEVYKIILELHKEDYPIDEDFIRKRADSQIVSDSILIEILSANAISNNTAYIQEMVEGYRKREIAKLATQIKKDLLEDGKTSDDTLDALQRAIDELESKSDSSDIRLAGEWDAVFENEPPLEKLKANIGFIDQSLDGGIDQGMFLFISGKKETGKTYIATSMMENMAYNGTKCGFFSMEFGTKTYIANIKKKYPHKDNKKRIAIMDNIYVEHRVTDINDIEKKIKKMHKKGVKFVFIDSQLRVGNAGMSKATKAEKLADSFSRIGLMCQRYEMVIAMVVQTSKADHDSDEISVKGCIDADHEASLWFHITKDKDSEMRTLVFAKNKQNFKRYKFDLKFNPTTHEFKVTKDYLEEGEDNENMTYKKTSSKEPETTTYQVDEEEDLLSNIDVNVDIPDIF